MVIASITAQNIHEVWSWNFKQELNKFLAAAAKAGPDSLIAIDLEFPGFLCHETRHLDAEKQYKMVRESVDLLRPIQIGFAVGSADGLLHGAWNFNLRFNLEFDLYVEASVQFLQNAGVDFYRHAAEGVCPKELGKALTSSALFCCPIEAPLWVTFSGMYDLAYLLSLLSSKPLPKTFHSYDATLAVNCPKRFELRGCLPWGSLESLVAMHSIHRCGAAHTAGSDARATLELYFRAAGATAHGVAAEKESVMLFASTEDWATAKQLVAATEKQFKKPSPPEPLASWGSAARCAMVGALVPRAGACALVPSQCLVGGA